MRSAVIRKNTRSITIRHVTKPGAGTSFHYTTLKRAQEAFRNKAGPHPIAQRDDCVINEQGGRIYFKGATFEELFPVVQRAQEPPKKLTRVPITYPAHRCSGKDPSGEGCGEKIKGGSPDDFCWTDGAGNYYHDGCHRSHEAEPKRTAIIVNGWAD
jgi:hypothetical protein